MTWASVKSFLFPTQEAQFPAFATEVERLSVIGLRVIAGVCVAAPVFSYLMGFLFLPELPAQPVVLLDVSIVLVGVVALFFSFWRPVARWARLLGLFVGGLVATLQTTVTIRMAGVQEMMSAVSPEQHFTGTLAMVLAVGMAALPVKPTQALGLGNAILAIFILTVFSEGGPEALAGWAALPAVFSLTIIAIFTGLTGVMYRQRARAFLALRRSEEALDELKTAQASLLVERNAASQCRFAAALSHELNTPLGSLSSAFETLVKLLDGFDERLRADPRRKQVLDDAVHSGQISFQRLNEIAQRMRHLTNLDRAEEQVVDLNELCSDTVAFLASELSTAKIELHTSQVPKIHCRPQQLGAVLSNLLRNAAAALDNGGNIELTTERQGDEVVIQVRDDGRGIEPERLEMLFEPAFHVDGGRIATTNWGLFVSRSIVSEHGGRLDIASEPGSGTTATLRLPA